MFLSELLIKYSVCYICKIVFVVCKEEIFLSMVVAGLDSMFSFLLYFI